MRMPALLLSSGLLLAFLPMSAQTQSLMTPKTDYVTIVNSGNARIAGYRLQVGASGNLQSVYSSHRGGARGKRNGHLTTYLTKRFFSDLKAAGSLANLPVGRRWLTPRREAYPGIHIYLRYHGEQSPDMRQVSAPTGEQLYQDIKQAIQVLRLPVPDTP